MDEHDAHDEHNKYETKGIEFTVLESMVDYINKVANSKRKVTIEPDPDSSGYFLRIGRKKEWCKTIPETIRFIDGMLFALVTLLDL